MLIATRHCTIPFTQWSRWARRSIVSRKAQQLAKAHSMHSIHIFCTNGLSKVYIVFRASVFAITRCSLCSFFMLIATHRGTIPFAKCLGVQVSKFLSKVFSFPCMEFYTCNDPHQSLAKLSYMAIATISINFIFIYMKYKVSSMHPSL